MLTVSKDNEDAEYLYTYQVKDKYTEFIHNIEVYKLDDGYGFRIDWMPINYKNEDIK